MLIHLTPSFFMTRPTPVDIARIIVPEINLHLSGFGETVKARTPYPNKCIVVATPRSSRRNCNGLFIETPAFLPVFTVICHWMVGNRQITHQVTYTVLDADHDAASDDMLLWSGFQRWPDRVPACHAASIPAKAQPRMRAWQEGPTSPDVPSGVSSEEDADPETGWVFERRQTFAIPTLERERITDPEKHLPAPMPQLSTLFHAG